jgi:hypothetical protein
VPDLPKTFAKWEFEVHSKEGKHRLSYEAAGTTFESHDVIVRGSPFVSFCRQKNERPTVHMLYQYAAEYSG